MTPRLDPKGEHLFRFTVPTRPQLRVAFGASIVIGG